MNEIFSQAWQTVVSERGTLQTTWTPVADAQFRSYLQEMGFARRRFVNGVSVVETGMRTWIHFDILLNYWILYILYLSCSSS